MKAIVNVGSNSYNKGQSRLRESLQGKTDADFFGFTSEEEVGSPKHHDNPYAFKIYAIESALNKGYTQILWLDSSVYALAPVQPIFNLIKLHGHFMEEAGHPASSWTNDRTLDYFGITRDESEKIPLYSAGFTGLNFNNDISITFFEMWKRAMLDGMFRGEWHNRNKTESQDPRCEGHRHDMSCASIIAHKLGMKYQPCGKYFQYAAPHEKQKQKTVIFFVQGI